MSEAKAAAVGGLSLTEQGKTQTFPIEAMQNLKTYAFSKRQ
jgi:hypothetical protein